MPQKYTQMHENNYQQGAMTFEYDVNYGANLQKTYPYSVDLKVMTQKNNKTGTVRRLRLYL